MVGVQAPQGNMATAKYSAVSSSLLLNRTSRGLVPISRLHLQIRNGNYHGRIHVGVGGGWPKSLRTGVEKLQIYKLRSFGFHGASQSAGFRNAMRPNIKRDNSSQQSNRHSKFSTRAGIS